MRLIPIGAVVSTHGIKGGIKVYIYNTLDPILLTLKYIFAGDEDMYTLYHITRSKRIDKRFCVVHLEGIITRKDAEELKGRKLLISPEMLPPIPENQVYISLLIGFCVFDLNGRDLGIVEDFINNGIQDIMIVKHINSGEFMVPFVDEFIKKIDTDRGQIFINLMEGLLE